MRCFFLSEERDILKVFIEGLDGQTCGSETNSRGNKLTDMGIKMSANKQALQLNKFTFKELSSFSLNLITIKAITAIY